MPPETVQRFLNEKEVFTLMFRRNVPTDRFTKLKKLGKELKKAPTV